jgi:hypothetical protein
MVIAGSAMLATKPMPTGAPTSIPNCHRIFFFLDQGFLPQKVQPDGLKSLKSSELRRLYFQFSYTLDNEDH